MSIISESDAREYLAALNAALQAHPQYESKMAFVDIAVAGNKLILTVAPGGICSDPEAYKVFDDLAKVLTLSGDTLEYEIRDRGNLIELDHHRRK